MKSLVVMMALAGAARADTMFASDHDGTLVVSKLAGEAFDDLLAAQKDPVDPYVHPRPQTEGTGLFFLEDCTTYLEAVIAIEPGAIATTEGGKAWKLRRGAKVLATFTANRVVALPL